ncbi:CHAT domain-containing protein [Terracoccus luteus]|uniref:Tetratricopeptide (TPR) repeat protein n=1 Tax=Terracoccus luteus TaxID=53356 RepID=A0A839PZU5_9MICO|nr:CHAT domain-containing protein [Terracoccus luteus]MBB2987526.1 tetratricopeptide (TPR) repeat protein [Terracoccus luteus]MCP2173177.1 tetratricopeptide (TPR) repeat protein [Terracoccus luteus]
MPDHDGSVDAHGDGAVDGDDGIRARVTLRANTLITLSLTEFLVGGLAPATARLEQARRVVEEAADADLMARLEYQRANILGRSGQLAAALDGLETALGRLTAFTPREQCSVHLSRGMLAFELGRATTALESFEQAAGIAAEHGLTAQEHMARHNSGYATYLLGELPRALALMDRAQDLADPDTSRGMEQLDRARVLLEAGLLTEAVEALRSGVAEVAGAGNDLLEAEFDLELARAHHLLGRADAATVAAESSAAAYARLGATAWEARATLTALKVDLDRHRRAVAVASVADATDAQAGALTATGLASLTVAAAAATADDLARRAVGLGDPELADQARVVAGEALLLAGDVDAARDRLVGPRRSAPGSLADELRLAAATAELHVTEGEPRAARRVLAGAVKRLAAGQQGSASLDLRTARAVHGVRLAALDLDLAVPRGSAAVLETLERWRSATDRLPSLARPDDERLAELTETLRSVRAQQRAAAGQPGPAGPESPGADPGADPALLELHRRATRLEQQIRARDWALGSRDGAAAAVPVRVREARSLLDRADRDLVWLFAHRGRLCGVGVVGGRAALRDLMPLAEAREVARRIRLDLRAAATQHLGALAGVVWRSLETDVARLDDALVRPWRAQRAGLVLVTSPEVSTLPWALCPSLVARPLTVARSLTSFARRAVAREQRPDGPPTVHVAVGPGLTRAGDEARAVAATWRAVGAEVEMADPSTGRGLVQALAHGRVVHAAAHGTHAVQSPLFSNLELHDGPVFAHELQPVGVTAEHVVLSACDVGSATFRPGDEQLGLAASVFSLGAHSVVASTAPIPDDVAAATMTAHHEALARGSASDEALAAAVAATDPVAAAFLNLGGRFVP